MADIWKALGEDHAQAENLIAKLEKLETPDEELFQELADLVTIHIRIKEDMLYPALAEIDENIEAQAEEQTGEIDDMVQELVELSSEDEDWSGKFEELAAALRRHFEFEQSQIIPMMKKKIKTREANSLGKQYAERRKEEMAALYEEEADDEAEADDETAEADGDETKAGDEPPQPRPDDDEEEEEEDEEEAVAEAADDDDKAKDKKTAAQDETAAPGEDTRSADTAEREPSDRPKRSRGGGANPPTSSRRKREEEEPA